MEGTELVPIRLARALGDSLSASGLTRAINCPPSVVLPPSSFTTSYGIYGRVIHAFIFAVLGGVARAIALAEIAADEPAREACESLDINILPKGGQQEVAFAWSWKTGRARVLGINIGRRYREHGLRDDEIPGSADFAGAQPGVAVIVDWKTGYLLERARDSWQLGFLAVCQADVLGVDHARVGHLILREDQAPRWDIAELDAMHLAATRTRLQRLVETIEDVRLRYAAGEPLSYSQGLWCKYCEAFDRCEAKGRLAREMLAGLDAILPMIDALTPEGLGQLLVRIERWDQIRDRVLERIDERVVRGELIAYGDGRVRQLAPGRASDSIINAHGALTVLAQMCGIKFAELATETGKGKIQGAVREWAKENARKIGESQEFVIDEIRKAGHIKKLPGKVEPRTIKPEK